MPRTTAFALLLTALSFQSVESRLGLLRILDGGNNVDKTNFALKGVQPIQSFEFLMQEDARSTLRYLADGSMSMLAFSMSMATTPVFSDTPTAAPTASPSTVAPTTIRGTTTSPPSAEAPPTTAMPSQVATRTNSPTVVLPSLLSTASPTVSSPDAVVSSPTTDSNTNSPTTAPDNDAAAGIQDGEEGGSGTNRSSSRGMDSGLLASMIVLVTAGVAVGLAVVVVIVRRRRRRRQNRSGNDDLVSEDDSMAV